MFPACRSLNFRNAVFLIQAEHLLAHNAFVGAGEVGRSCALPICCGWPICHKLCDRHADFFGHRNSDCYIVVVAHKLSDLHFDLHELDISDLLLHLNGLGNFHGFLDADKLTHGYIECDLDNEFFLVHLVRNELRNVDINSDADKHSDGFFDGFLGHEFVVGDRHRDSHGHRNSDIHLERVRQPLEHGVVDIHCERVGKLHKHVIDDIDRHSNENVHGVGVYVVIDSSS